MLSSSSNAPIIMFAENGRINIQGALNQSGKEGADDRYILIIHTIHII